MFEVIIVIIKIVLGILYVFGLWGLLYFAVYKMAKKTFIKYRIIYVTRIQLCLFVSTYLMGCHFTWLERIIS